MENNYDGVFLTDFDAGQPGLHQRALGAYHMASVLRQRGLKIKVLDYIYSFSKTEIELLVSLFISEKTKFIGLSTTFMYNKLLSMRFDQSFYMDDPVTIFLNKAQKINPQIQLIQGGGFHFNKHPSTRFLLPGQYVENKLIQYLNENLKLNLNADYVFTQHEFAFDTEDEIIENESLPVEISRGCIFSCKFCAFSGRGKKINDNIKPMELIEKYLRQSYAQYGTRNFYLADDTFNESEVKLSRFYEMIQGLNFNPQFTVYARIDLLMKYPKMIELLVGAGVKGISFGIETFHSKAAQTIGKGVAPEKIKDYLVFIKKNYPQLYLSSGFIMGLPYESVESCYETNQWLIKNQALDSWQFAPLVLDNKLLNPHPSEFSKSIERYNYVREGDLGWKRSDLNFLEASKICRDLNDENAHYIGPSPWVLFGFLREQKFEEIRHIKNENLSQIYDFKKFEIYKHRTFQSQYKRNSEDRLFSNESNK